MKQLVTILILSLTLNACARENAPEPLSGTWQYDIIVNGTPMGRAEISTEHGADQIVTITKMAVTAGTTENRTKSVTIETPDFQPVSIESVNTVIHGAMKEEITIKAVFNGKTVTLYQNGVEETVELTSDFYLDGGYAASLLQENRFKKTYTASFHIYDPSLDPYETVPVTLTVEGEKMIQVGSKKIKLHHVTQLMEDMKKIHTYMDNQGVVYMVSMSMLNNNIVLIRSDLK